MEYIHYNKEPVHYAFEYTNMRKFRGYVNWTAAQKETSLHVLVKQYSRFEDIETVAIPDIFVDNLLTDTIEAIEYFEYLEEYEICSMFFDLYKLLIERPSPNP
tara:strand:- start:804 stop:1112 length:309 start_codon:yes stop_codon:yes gene_type:complete